MVLAVGEVVSQREVTGVKTKRNSQGGTAQARYQRHIENFHLQHIKEVIEALDKIVQRENIAEIVVAGDEVVLPLLREQMPKHLQQKVVEHVRMNVNSPVEQLIDSSLDTLRRAHTQDEREKVDAAVGGFRSGGLGVVGPEDTLEALVKGQVDELLISSQLGSLQPVGALAPSTAADSLGAVLSEPVLEPIAAGEPADADAGMVRLADELVTRATQTSAKITFIENGELLAGYGGVAAILRFRI
jgi:peptide subunit release factor 1 (eRF1)